jgi:ATP-binding cassette subfamily F protein uup
MIEWLEHYLSNKDLSLLLVTHDRYFLNEVCTQIIEIENHQLYYYQGDFQYYVEKKDERLQIESSEVDKAKNLFKRELEWMRKMPKARGTKSKSRITAFYEVEEKAKAKKQDQKIDLSVKMTRLGGKIIELIKLSKAYGDKIILDGFTYTFRGGEKIGIVGKNGCGKSTFLSMILGLEASDSGKIQTGDTIVFGYYSQKGMELKEEKRVIEIVKDIGEFIPLASGASMSASQLLTRFNFPPDVQYGFVSKLSGGEKRRLYLLTILMKNPNFLILDEPTNDLDIATLQTLEDFLSDFKGCVLIVSHDRYFLDKIIDHVFAFEGNGIIKDFPGNYSEYRIWKDEQEKLLKAKPEKEVVKSIELKPEPTIEKTQPKKLTFNEQREAEMLDKEIASLENEKKEIEEKLSQSLDLDLEKITALSERVGVVSNLIDEKSLRWLELQEKIEIK